MTNAGHLNHAAAVQFRSNGLNRLSGLGTLEFMEEYLSPSARRAVRAAGQRATQLGAAQVECRDLLLAVAEQEESLGATVLVAHGLELAMLRGTICLSDEPIGPDADSIVAAPLSPAVRQVLNAVRSRSVERGPDNPAGTDLVLLELLVVSSETHELLVSLGIDVPALIGDLQQRVAAESQPLRSEFQQLQFADVTDTVDIYRVLDAAANRAREGLRVLEDYARFVCDDRLLTSELKQVRHDLTAALDRLPRHELLGSRETRQDVGTTLRTAGEWSREHVLDVVTANFKRTQEALRSLEEFGKIECRPLAEAMEAARYRLYTLERVALIGAESRARMDGVVLYVIVSSESCRGGLEWTVREALAGGAQVIQLREKRMSDRELLALAHRVRDWTREAGALFIVNDRPDIARLAEADGVHVGQEELSVREVRRVVGVRALVGVSTHSIEQARQAVLDGANYIGVGPTFPSGTKAFDAFPGLELIRQVHAEIRLPAFAIGGIDLARLDDVVAAGARRVAVSAAVCANDDPRSVARELRRRLDAAGQSTCGGG